MSISPSEVLIDSPQAFIDELQIKSNLAPNELLNWRQIQKDVEEGEEEWKGQKEGWQVDLQEEFHLGFNCILGQSKVLLFIQDKEKSSNCCHELFFPFTRLELWKAIASIWLTPDWLKTNDSNTPPPLKAGDTFKWLQKEWKVLAVKNGESHCLPTDSNYVPSVIRDENVPSSYFDLYLISPDQLEKILAADYLPSDLANDVWSELMGENRANLPPVSVGQYQVTVISTGGQYQNLDQLGTAIYKGECATLDSASTRRISHHEASKMFRNPEDVLMLIPTNAQLEDCFRLIVQNTAGKDIEREELIIPWAVVNQCRSLADAANWWTQSSVEIIEVTEPYSC